jgi:hypothetical protein
MSSSAYNAIELSQQARPWASVAESLQQASVVTSVSWEAVATAWAWEASVDTLTFRSRHRIRGAERFLEDLCDKVTVDPIKVKKTEQIVGWLYKLTRPHNHLREISRWMVRMGIKTSRLDIACDHRFADEFVREAVRAYMRRHLVVKNGARGVQRKDWLYRGDPTGNFYSDDFNSPGRPAKSRGRSTRRNFAVYLKPNDGLRLEVRLSQRTVKRYVDNPAEILDYDPGDIISHELRLRFFKPSWVKEQEARDQRDLLLGRRPFKSVLHRTLQGLLTAAPEDERLAKLLAKRLKQITMVKPFTLGKNVEWAPSVAY